MSVLKLFIGSKRLSSLLPLFNRPSLPFEIMCDASDYTVRAILGKQRDNNPYVIYYASKTLNEVQQNYTTAEEELVAIVFATEKIRPYLLCSKVIIYTDHSALKHLLDKGDSKPELIRWVLLL